MSVCGKWMFRPNAFVVADGIHSHTSYLDNSAMSLRSPIFLCLLIVFITLVRYFERKIDYNLRSVFVLANSLSASENPFLYDSRKLRRPQVKDRKLRDASLQREFNINLVSYRYKVTHLVGKNLQLTQIWDAPPSYLGSRKLQKQPTSCQSCWKEVKGGFIVVNQNRPKPK